MNADAVADILLANRVDALFCSLRRRDRRALPEWAQAIKFIFMQKPPWTCQGSAGDIKTPCRSEKGLRAKALALIGAEPQSFMPKHPRQSERTARRAMRRATAARWVGVYRLSAPSWMCQGGLWVAKQGRGTRHIQRGTARANTVCLSSGSR